jgi:predicted molibdopterin-dependent oxidoreductase YjgC
LLPGGVLSSNSKASDLLRKKWKIDTEKIFQNSGMNIPRKIREDKIRAAFIIGENPAASQEYNSFINNLEFLVVADMFNTETVNAADVFLPLSSYLETTGNFTNWSGVQQPLSPIGVPANGMQTIDIIKRLCSVMNYSVNYNSVADITNELAEFVNLNLKKSRLNGTFLTQDAKAHFALYSETIAQTPAQVPSVLAIDSRVADRNKQIKI